MSEISTQLQSKDWIIQTQALQKEFNQDAAVEDVTMQIPAGSIFGFIGPSGCGKSTTVRLLLGIYKPTSGEATVLGEAPQNFSTRTRERIGYMPQLFILEPGLTVWQNLSFTASLYGMGFGRKKRLQEVLDLVELTGQERKRARDLSGGMQTRLSLASSLAHDPELLFLDEPTTGIDPVLRAKFWDYFHQLKSEGRTLFITTQYVNEAAYCDYVGVMSNGRLLMVETPENLKRVGLGGDVVSVKFGGFISNAKFEDLQTQPFIVSEQVRIDGGQTIWAVVRDAEADLPALLNWCQTNEIAVERAGKLEPSFDDVFIRIITEHRNNARVS